GFRGDPGVDLSRNEKIVKRCSWRRDFELEPRRRLPVPDFFRPVRDPGNRLQIHPVFLFQDAARPKRCRGKPGLQTDAPAVEILWRANAGALIDVNIRMAKHPFHKNRNRRKPQGPLLQIGHINAGEKFCHIESAMTPIALAAAVIRVDLNFQIDVAWPYPSVDERLAAIVKRAGHAEFQWHRATSL